MVSKSGKHNIPSEEDTQEMCPLHECKWENERDNWLNSKILVIGGTIATVLLGSIITFFIHITSMDTRIVKLEEKEKMNPEYRIEINNNFKELKMDNKANQEKMIAELTAIKIQISKLEKDRTP